MKLDLTVSAIALAIAATTLSAVALAAPQPLIPTPAAPPILTNVYEIPYAVYGPNEIGGFNYTVVTIGNPRANGVSCRVQVQWYDWDATSAGFSGPPVTLGLDETLEFTSSPAPGAVPSPYVLNVFRNLDTPFEGHAKIRSTCTSPRALRIDAEAVFVDPRDPAGGRPTFVIDPIKVVRPTGNVGD
jgi:hypothetical protein